MVVPVMGVACWSRPTPPPHEWGVVLEGGTSTTAHRWVGGFLSTLAACCGEGTGAHLLVAVGLARCWVLREQPVGCFLGVESWSVDTLCGCAGWGGLRVVTVSCTAGSWPSGLVAGWRGWVWRCRSLLENCTVDASIFE